MYIYKYIYIYMYVYMKREDFWIKKLKTLHPYGLNAELNWMLTLNIYIYIYIYI